MLILKKHNLDLNYVQTNNWMKVCGQSAGNSQFFYDMNMFSL